MTNRIKGLTFESRINADAGLSKLFLGVLGVEYSIPFHGGGGQSFDVFNMASANKPTADRLLYDYVNRTANREEWAYSDGVLPIYLRFQPDVGFPLDQAANGVESGAIYNSYWIELDEPIVTITGQESNVDDNGQVTFSDQPVTFVVPVNPPSIRKVRLSVQDGLTLFLARIR
ncbi:hypothetical protein [Rhizobium leguminosarum]|uniref:hypothetical protein n=1 Tax=Rhizobium leguminosarum TaxID=384 RepID=UPI00102F6AA5|nr:hypothetical protein [Rhizobium leguminosarum]TBG52587.1 hypothetical protein ELG74_36440 [Rhizobium leguminosarum]